MRVSLRPDPRKGVFETMLVIGGRAIELDAHLERLSASLATLYGNELSSEVRATAIDRASAIEHGKLRVTVAPPGPAWRVDTEEVEADAVFPGPERGASLRTTVLSGGLGEHKWADRRLLDAAAALPGELPLLLDADGIVLEASRGSVFAILGERLVTPPVDGRILPSIARRQAIEVAIAAEIEVREEDLRLTDLLTAEAFLTGSVRGVEPVRAVDGAQLPLNGEISARVATALRNRWLRAPAAAPVAVAAGGQRADPPGR